MLQTYVACCCLAALAAGCESTPSAAVVARRDTRAAPQRDPTTAGHDWTQFGWDARRSSASTDPTGISAANASSLQRQQVPIDGTVDASPIYLSGVTVNGTPHDVFFVTTTYGKTIAIDANDGSTLWTYTPPGFAAWAGSYQITNATPIADPDRAHIYAASPDGAVQKLTVADGHALWRTAVTALPQREKLTSSLNLFNNRVVVVTGGYVGDAPPYQGHLALLDTATGRLDRVWNSLCSDRAALLDPRTCDSNLSAIWGRAGAVVDPDTGMVYVATGNGPWDGRTNWGDATLVLSADATTLLGNYTPANTDALARTDLDLGSTSPVLLGNGFIVQGGKDGQLRLLSVDQLTAPGAHRGGELQSVPTPSGGDLFTAPAVFRTADATWLFAADNGGTAAWRFVDGRLVDAWRNRTGGTSPVFADGLLYVYDPRGGLHIYEPSTGREVATLDCGAGHWNSPIVADGRIALPEGSANAQRLDGVLDIWRLP
jgi:outer membrane protein assembly factor BamB